VLCKKNVHSTRISVVHSNCLPQQEQGCTGARLFNHGFPVGMVADLVWSGLATRHRETVRVGHKKIKVARTRITDAGRRALEG
jgi:hypothetical protein